MQLRRGKSTPVPVGLRSRRIGGPALLALALASWRIDAQQAEEVYKCIRDGAVSYSASPDSGNCQRIDLQVSQPSPEELARLADEKRRRQQAEDAAAAKDREERLTRAKELEAQAAWRRAIAAEDQARLMREQEQASQAWGYYYPSWWGYTLYRPPARMHRRFAGEPPMRDLPDGRRGGGIRFGFGGKSRTMR